MELAKKQKKDTLEENGETKHPCSTPIIKKPPENP
jgi:hypothetical protein